MALCQCVRAPGGSGCAEYTSLMAPRAVQTYSYIYLLDENKQVWLSVFETFKALKGIVPVFLD